MSNQVRQILVPKAAENNPIQIPSQTGLKRIMLDPHGATSCCHCRLQSWQDMTVSLPDSLNLTINPTLLSNVPTFLGQENAIHCTSSADSLPVEAMQSNTVRGRQEFGLGKGKQQCVLLLCHIVVALLREAALSKTVYRG